MDIEGYEVKRTIGRGGMAIAYLAIQNSLGREVVLKVMNSSQSDNKDFLERFQNEAQIVAALRHPHIITIHDIGSAGELVYIAMEYVDGGDLKARLGERCDPDMTLDVVSKIASALGYAHEQGIIHRDIKPANILFRGDDTVLLSDFGIAKQLQVDSELTSTGTILGSPFYMSPEQAEGQEVDGRTDIYSLGVILYEMLTGERPYQGDSAIKVIMQHIQSPMPVLPEDLGKYQPLLARLMAKDRERRVTDALSLVDEIATYRSGASVVAGAAAAAPPPAVADALTRSTAFSAKQRVGLLLGTLMILGGMFYGFYVYTQSMRSPQFIRRAAQVEPVETNVATQAGVQANLPAMGSGVEQQDVTKALEWLARNSIRDDRLTHPPADNAYYYYSRLLALDPNNEAAKKGFGDIAERFVVLAEQEFSSQNVIKAQTYVALGLQVDPDNSALMSLQSFIQNRKKSFFETLIGLFS